MEICPVRLHPGDDLKTALSDYARSEAIPAGWILSGIGSLRRAAIRFAHQERVTVIEDYFELVALAGTLSVHGVHLHLAIANSQGDVLGGHLATGSIIYTTAEIVIGITTEFTFTREPDSQTGFRELAVQRNVPTEA